VVGRRPDGYHLLDSLVSFADVGDELTVERAGAGELSAALDGPTASAVTDTVADLSDLSVITAAQALRERAGPGAGAHLRLTKNLPVAAGVGGGSADAAAALRALDRLWGLGLGEGELADIGLAVGADVPVCVGGRPARMAGIGEELSPLDAWPALDAVLVNPRAPVPTGPVFRALHDSAAPFAPAPPDASAVRGGADAVAYLRACRNSLEPPALSLAPVVGEVLEALEGAGAELARMSGSGATCFGLFADAAGSGAAAAALSRGRPDWWVRACRLAGAAQ
ncbi:MAG: 4-(cytidine 5'-diphospho)-2-C-methyl-D-erythritol kinase, partial [Caulobacterales bacterium]|nr:4-(cytidine 5'-diphospho)-2-C-methyl-D-erythritol kinase [Caulobacterales bacterium]